MAITLLTRAHAATARDTPDVVGRRIIPPATRPLSSRLFLSRTAPIDTQISITKRGSDDRPFLEACLVGLQRISSSVC